MYRLSAFYFARTASDLPMEFTLPSVYILMCAFTPAQRRWMPVGPCEVKSPFLALSPSFLTTTSLNFDRCASRSVGGSKDSTP